MDSTRYRAIDLSAIAEYLTRNTSTGSNGSSPRSTTPRGLWLNTAKHYLRSVLPHLSLQNGHQRLFARADLEDIEKGLKNVVQLINESTSPDFATLPLVGFYEVAPGAQKLLHGTKYFKIMPQLLIIHIEQVTMYLPGETSLSQSSLQVYVERAKRDETIERLIFAVLPSWDKFSQEQQLGLMSDLRKILRWLGGEKLKWIANRGDYLATLIDHHLEMNKGSAISPPPLKLDYLPGVLEIHDNHQSGKTHSLSHLSQRKQILYPDQRDHLSYLD